MPDTYPWKNSTDQRCRTENVRVVGDLFKGGGCTNQTFDAQ